MTGLVWIGHRGVDAEILTSVAPARAIICCDWDADLCALTSKVSISSIERLSFKRLTWSSASLGLISQQSLGAAFRSLPHDEAIGVIPYRSTQALEEVLSSFPNMRLAAAHADIVDNLDDKEVQRKLFKELGLPMPRWSMVKSDDLAENATLGKIGFPAVVQIPRSSLGIGTFLVESSEELQRLKVGAGGKFLVSECLPGPVVNATAVIGRGDVHIAWPSIQLVGLASCTGVGHPFQYCGNDFGAISNLPSNAVDRLFSCIRVLANGLRRIGYLGIFGTDWIFKDGRWFILELNPRFQGSTLLLSTLEQAAGGVPLAVEHVRAFLGDSAVLAVGKRSSTPEPLTGGQVVLYQRHSDWVTVGGSVAALPTSSSANRQRCRIVGAPIAGTVVAPGAILARLFLSGSVLDWGLGKLAQDVEEQIEMVYHVLDLKDSEQ